MTEWPNNGIEFNRWYTGLTRFIAMLRRFQWIKNSRFKYVNIRIDTRNGYFLVLSDHKADGQQDRVDPMEIAQHVDMKKVDADISSDRAVVSIKPMKLSDGRTDFFVSIKIQDRDVTPHVFREEYKAAYHVALYDWLLNGKGEEPEVVDFGPNDWPARVMPASQDALVTALRSIYATHPICQQAADVLEQGDRERRHGANLLQLARQCGWKDDGEGALEFMLRRSREVAIEDCTDAVCAGS
ncbi:hypothetical protein [Bradyrhizobium elkanii]|uniref:hypothetical protein n=1 Tax=Bradyrhizobium elkanii TaxID=29448 RepID=UPI00351305E9